MKVSIITPTTGAPFLKDCIESVKKQTYPDVQHVVVTDGSKYREAVDQIFTECQFSLHSDKQVSYYLPINVGANGFYGHRVYASFTHLVDSGYVCYLDQDNWLEPDHVEKCVNAIEKNKLDWCYSLRKVRTKNGDFLCNDDCESLGIWKTYHGNNHIDTNCFFLKTEIATKVASFWHGGWGQDRVFMSVVTKHMPNFNTTGYYTVNYRVDGGEGSVNADFFINGNAEMRKKYVERFPWSKEHE